PVAGSGLFDSFTINLTNNILSDVNFLSTVDVGVLTPANTLTIDFQIGNEANYDIQIDVLAATRLTETITPEFETPALFSLTQAVAIPEPSSVLALVSVGCGFAIRRRRA
ncbi:MAG: PEP-CTERM sorting domain-containing protein, partial [Planctomycetota bacterium]